MKPDFVPTTLALFFVLVASPLPAQVKPLYLQAAAPDRGPRLNRPIDESDRVAMPDHAAPVALHSPADLGLVPDDYPLAHLKLVLNRSPAVESALAHDIDAMHDPQSPEYHHWLTAQQFGERYGIAAPDLAVIREWLTGHGFTVHGLYRGGFAIDFSGNAGQLRAAFHTELHNIVLPNGERHVSNLSDAQIPAALAPAVRGIASLHDFRPRSRAKIRGAMSYDRKTGAWQPKFSVKADGETYHAVAPYDFATIYDLLPLWNRGYTGKGVTIALIEDSNLAHPADWATFRLTFGLDRFTQSSFEQIYPNAFAPDPSCTNPGQNGDEIESALDVEWASASAPDAKIQLVACANTNTTSGLDTAILNLLDTHPPDIISDSYGYCETISGAAEVALENLEEQQAAAQGVTFFIAQGDNGSDQCSYGSFSDYGINSGDNTASSYVVDVGGTDFMAQYNSDVNGIPVDRYWSARNDPQTLASALSYVPETPWNDSCASQLVYSDPVNGGYTGAYGPKGFCNSAYARENFYVNNGAGSGEASTCFTGKAATFGVVGGTCKGNPKPAWQTGVPGIPRDGLRDQPDLSFFSADGAWGSLLVECLSDTKQGGTACTPYNDAIMLGGGGTSFASPAMAGIQALIDQKYGKQGNANYVYYALAAKQFTQQPGGACSASNTTGALPSAACIFRDINHGDNAVPCGENKNGHYYDCFGEVPAEALGVLSTSTTQSWRAYKANAGYDFPTGLGSVDASRLFDAWPTKKE